ncbi:MAG: hypothetical protein ACYDD1_11020 [Caulobacteraceae bacterium]
MILQWGADAAYLLGGAFLSNAVPHLVSGVTGRAFQSPFAKPPGVGLSTATVNVLWGFANLVLAYLLLVHVGRFDLRTPQHALALGAGLLLMSLLSARLFGRLHGGEQPARS